MRAQDWVICLAGVLLFPLCSLYVAKSHFDERRARAYVLETGHQARGLARHTGRPDSVVVEWTDDKGQKRVADGWTGKLFAIHMKEPTAVTLKYVDDRPIGPVILEQVQERDQANEWWIRSSAVQGALSVFLGLAALWRSKYSPRKEAMHRL